MINPGTQKEYSVSLGPGFGRPPESSADRVVALRYNFKPDSIDDSKASTLTRSGSEYTLVSPGTQNGESFVFSGQSSEAKDVDCVLIYDEKTESFVLHNLSETIRLKPQRSVPTSLKPVAANGLASSAPSPARAAPKPAADRDRVIDLPSFDAAKPASAARSEPAAPRPQAVPDAAKRATAARAAPKRAATPSESESGEDDVARARQSAGTRLKPVAKRARHESSSSDEDDAGEAAAQGRPEAVSTDESSDDGSEPARSRQPVGSVKGPISLRGYNGGGRVEDDISSSSEEE